jgi:hypothetical protein
MVRVVLLIFLWTLIVPPSRSQNVPLGHWENHFNYLSAQHVLQVRDHVFASTYNGLFSVKPLPIRLSKPGQNLMD